MTDLTPDTVTETIRVDQLTPGRTILMPCEPETVTEIWTAHGYVNFRTDKTGPAAAYQWPAGNVIDVVRAAEATPGPVADLTAAPRPVPTTEDRMRDARTDRSFATYLDATERDQLDARAATAEQERDDALDDRDTARAEAANLRRELDKANAGRQKLQSELDTMTQVAQGNKRHVTYLTALIERIYDDTTAEQLAQARQELAHKGTGYVPPWHGLTDHERETSTLEARNWLRAMRNLLDPTKLPPSSVPPRRAQEDPTAEALAEHLTAYQWYSKPEFPLLHEPSAHREHIYNSDCAICRGDLSRIAAVALAYVQARL